MKICLASLTIALFICISGLSQAQSVPALSNGNGRYLTATTRATPPVNMVTAADFTGVTELVAIDFNTMAAEKSGKISSFTMTVITPSGNSTLESKSGLLTDAMITKLRKLLPGDKVYFEYIKYLQADGNETQMTAMAFQVQ
jgi:hypothetical protein